MNRCQVAFYSYAAPRNKGSKFESYEPGYYRMVKEDRRENVVIIASGNYNLFFLLFSNCISIFQSRRRLTNLTGSLCQPTQ